MNYSIETTDSSKVFLDAKSYRPYQSKLFELRIYCDPQHDGHCWNEPGVEWAEIQLVEEIVDALRKHVKNFVNKVDPYAIHRKEPKKVESKETIDSLELAIDKNDFYY